MVRLLALVLQTIGTVRLSSLLSLSFLVYLERVALLEPEEEEVIGLVW